MWSGMLFKKNARELGLEVKDGVLSVAFLRDMRSACGGTGVAPNLQYL